MGVVTAGGGGAQIRWQNKETQRKLWKDNKYPSVNSYALQQCACTYDPAVILLKANAK